jgi:hypothetical protein
MITAAAVVGPSMNVFDNGRDFKTASISFHASLDASLSRRQTAATTNPDAARSFS